MTAKLSNLRTTLFRLLLWRFARRCELCWRFLRLNDPFLLVEKEPFLVISRFFLEIRRGIDGAASKLILTLLAVDGAAADERCPAEEARSAFVVAAVPDDNPLLFDVEEEEMNMDGAYEADRSADGAARPRTPPPRPRIPKATFWSPLRVIVAEAPAGGEQGAEIAVDSCGSGCCRC